jgi:alanine racemase
MPVVKADAYRHGAREVARALEAEGATWLAVSNVEEGTWLRREGIRTRILVMADFLPEERDGLEASGLTPVIHSLDDLLAARVPYHLKIDSGMGRLGTRAAPDEVVRAVAAAPAPLEGVMTHFASSGNYESRQTEEQIARFDAVIAALREAGIAPRYIHASGTIPVAYRRREAWGNLVRPGHAIYGYVSNARGAAPKRQLDVRPALTWKATVLTVKDVEEGALIGYGGIHRANRPMRIAVLAAGYADGIPHRLGNRGHVIANGKLAPIVGAVSMDLTTIDVTASPELRVGRCGDVAGVRGRGDD